MIWTSYVLAISRMAEHFCNVLRREEFRQLSPLNAVELVETIAPNSRLVIVFASSVLPTPVVTGEKSYPIGRPPLGLSYTCDRTLDDVQHVCDGVLWPFNSSPHEFFGRTDLVLTDFAPRIFCDADLEAPDGIRDAIERYGFASRQLRYCADVEQQQALGFVHEALDAFVQLGLARILRTWKAAHQ